MWVWISLAMLLHLQVWHKYSCFIRESVSTVARISILYGIPREENSTCQMALSLSQDQLVQPDGVQHKYSI
jgi:hypothetical protein